MIDPVCCYENCQKLASYNYVPIVCILAGHVLLSPSHFEGGPSTDTTRENHELKMSAHEREKDIAKVSPTHTHTHMRPHTTHARDASPTHSHTHTHTHTHTHIHTTHTYTHTSCLMHS